MVAFHFMILATAVAWPMIAQNIPDLAAENADLSTLVTALKAGDLVGVLSGMGPFTVFVPTNKAFAKLDKALLTALLDPANKAKLVEVLEYHVASGKVLSSELQNGEKIMTLEKQDVIASIHGKSVRINYAIVTTADVMAANGVVHIIDTVLIPPGFVPPSLQSTSEPPQNIPDLASGNADLSTLVTALKAGDLVSTLSGVGPFTVFAPTNEAFAKLDKALLTALLDPANKAKLVEILEYHVASGKVLSSELKDREKIMTLEKQDVTVSIDGSNVRINHALVTTADVMAANGVVHIIDTVLVPPGFVPPQSEIAALVI